MRSGLWTWSSAVAAAAVGCSFTIARFALPEQPPAEPIWGPGPVQPSGGNAHFVTGDGCAMCHSASPNATAVRSPTGDDVSPHGLWQATMMANAFRDPYWRASVAREVAAAPDPASAARTQALCITCHAPMEHHSARLAGGSADSVAALVTSALANDGVSCTVCHQAQPTNLGTQASFAGNLDIRPGRAIFGPYADPAPGPMKMHSLYTPTHGEHIRSAGLCASCHTLHTEHALPEGRTGRFPEQTPYLEWLNSDFAPGRVAAATCQECHMPDVGPMKIARNPAGVDFNIKVRPGVRGHAFIGGNAFMLDLLRANAAALGVTAPAEALTRMAAATRTQLAQRTAMIEVSEPRRENGRLNFTVAATNLTGHKFPAGYPSRRAWLQVQVRDGRTTVFDSGSVDRAGRLSGVADELALPFPAIVDDPAKVPVFEMVALDGAGTPTTLLTAMTTRHKDTRLLPRGWRPDGPHGAETAPAGVEAGDAFAPGRAVVRYSVALPPNAGDRLTIVAWIRYQPIPPAWVEPLRSVKSPEAESFVRMYDAAKHDPETVAVTVTIESAGEAP